MGKGQSMMRLSLFTIENYPLWRMRFENFIQSIDLDIWDIILEGLHVPTKLVDSVRHVKKKAEWDDKDRKLVQLNHKTIKALFCALSESEFNRVTTSTLAKDIWDILKNCYDRTNQVKESKISFLTLDYELFKIKEEKPIKEMYEIFTKIIEGLKALGKEFPNA
ncbi:Uncharacterized protein TCM_024438 [Theobroma cacao]|uniref:DUF4219 domain-containing protein/UBN2 domain-containing protein n=1 Tax=Theobroma cacao TaxID=3641 RepID=A0A061EXC8_THECC|nr:Uncharacterized protein TCM_024438 [Theobroma cacao]